VNHLLTIIEVHGEGVCKPFTHKNVGGKGVGHLLTKEGGGEGVGYLLTRMEVEQV
jgi:hypothetical protein